jgi:hypothetical protein
MIEVSSRLSSLRTLDRPRRKASRQIDKYHDRISQLERMFALLLKADIKARIRIAISLFVYESAS